jgi:hypothetical protein
MARSKNMVSTATGFYTVKIERLDLQIPKLRENAGEYSLCRNRKEARGSVVG